MKKKSIGFVVVLLIGMLCKAEDFPKNYFRAPLDIPMYLSGNFGELRTNHYHSGIDIKTQRKVGFKVYAVADGYVSRVKISPYGYGNAIYITHPNGYTTVYGHLLRLSAKLERYVKVRQYEKESFAVDEYFPKELITVAKGEVIALSGNSGSSGGPHLHFEIRDTETEFPMNPLKFGFPIKDAVPPVMRTLYISPIDVENTGKRKAYALVKKGTEYRLEKGVVPKVSGRIGFALDARDYMSETSNYYGIYSLRLYVDNELKHSFTFDKFSFSESGAYFNAHIDYELFKRDKRRAHKLFHEPNHEESFSKVSNNGIYFSGEKLHAVRIIIADTYGNETSLKFQAESVNVLPEPVDNKFLNYSEQNYFGNDSVFVKIPALALYRDTEKSSIRALPSANKAACSSEFQLLKDEVALAKKAMIGIKPQGVPKDLHSKVLLAKVQKGRYSYVGNRFVDGFVTGKTKELGTFVLLLDTVAPVIELWRGANYKTTGKLRYKITDALSGIASFRGTIDGKWVLFEYDPKRRLLSHTLDSSIIKKGEKHHLELKVVDNCGNESIRKVSFSW